MTNRRLPSPTQNEPPPHAIMHRTNPLALAVLAALLIAIAAPAFAEPSADPAETPTAAQQEAARVNREVDALGAAADAGAAVDKLLAMLKGGGPGLRWRCARSLGRLGPAAAKAAPTLVGCLSDASPIVRLHAAVALAKIGDSSEPTLEVLIQKVTDEDPRVSRIALQALRALDAPPAKTADALEAVLESGDAAVMSHAVDAIVARGADATPFLVASLQKPRSAYWAALAISEIGPDAAATATPLIEALGQATDADTQRTMLIALAKLGPAAAKSADAVDALAKATDDAGVRIAACYALGAIGANASTPTLTELETAGGEFQAMACAWALAKTHPDDPGAMQHAVTSLVAGLQSDREEMRNAAAAGLKELDAPAELASDALIAAVRDATPEQRSHMAMAMASLGPQVVDRAVRALTDPDLRPVAIEVLGRLGADAAGGVEGLKQVLADASDETIAQAQFALASIGEQAATAAGDLSKSLASESENVRQSALYALRQLGAGAEAAKEPLQEFLASTDNKFEQYATAWALARMRLETAVLDKVTASLSAALESDDERVRLETIAAIRDLGPAGKAFDAKLKELAESDPSTEVRAAASK